MKVNHSGIANVCTESAEALGAGTEAPRGIKVGKARRMPVACLFAHACCFPVAYLLMPTGHTPVEPATTLVL
eukprot:366490-Chlamydomonas_euryale.AAC.35